jgi:hypothetical protein
VKRWMKLDALRRSWADYRKRRAWFRMKERQITEAEWLMASDPAPMLRAIQRSGSSERKVRLLNAAICRRFWHYLPEASQAILSESELLADGLAQVTSDELCRRANGVVGALDQQYPNKNFPSPEARIQREAATAVCYAVLPDELWAVAGCFWEVDPAEKLAQAVLIRDVFGNPFRPTSVDPLWLRSHDGAAVKRAQAIYDNRAFERMPMLADILEQAGCQDAAILAHCRRPGPHVRGCWVIDLLLGKV